MDNSDKRARDQAFDSAERATENDEGNNAADSTSRDSNETDTRRIRGPIDAGSSSGPTTTAIHGGQEDNTCAICLESLLHGPRSVGICMPCKHLFHEDCFLGWQVTSAQSQNSRTETLPRAGCPTCRATVHQCNPYLTFLNENYDPANAVPRWNGYIVSDPESGLSTGRDGFNVSPVRPRSSVDPVGRSPASQNHSSVQPIWPGSFALNAERRPPISHGRLDALLGRPGSSPDPVNSSSPTSRGHLDVLHTQPRTAENPRTGPVGMTVEIPRTPRSSTVVTRPASSTPSISSKAASLCSKIAEICLSPPCLLIVFVVLGFSFAFSFLALFGEEEVDGESR